MAHESPLHDQVVLEAHRPSSGYFFPFLDGLRGIAILSVVAYHIVYFNSDHVVGKVLLSLVRSGNLGVPIFFTLSGFLISLSVFSSGHPFNQNAYAWRRGAKILPPFLLCVALIGAFNFWWKGGNGLLSHLLFDVTTLSHFKKGFPYTNASYWSLYIEVQFYLLLPVIYLFIRKHSRSPMLTTCLIFLLIPAVFRLFDYCYVGNNIPREWGQRQNLFPRGLDYFSGGMFFALIFIKHRTNAVVVRSSWYLAHAGVILLVATYLLEAAHVYFNPAGGGPPAWYITPLYR